MLDANGAWHLDDMLHILRHCQINCQGDALRSMATMYCVSDCNEGSHVAWHGMLSLTSSMAALTELIYLARSATAQTICYADGSPNRTRGGGMAEHGARSFAHKLRHQLYFCAAEGSAHVNGKANGVTSADHRHQLCCCTACRRCTHQWHGQQRDISCGPLAAAELAARAVRASSTHDLWHQLYLCTADRRCTRQWQGQRCHISCGKFAAAQHAERLLRASPMHDRRHRLCAFTQLTGSTRALRASSMHNHRRQLYLCTAHRQCTRQRRGQHVASAAVLWRQMSTQHVRYARARCTVTDTSSATRQRHGQQRKISCGPLTAAEHAARTVRASLMHGYWHQLCLCTAHRQGTRQGHGQ